MGQKASVKESMFCAKNLPSAEIICKCDKKLPQIVVVMSPFWPYFPIKRPKGRLNKIFDSYMSIPTQIKGLNFKKNPKTSTIIA